MNKPLISQISMSLDTTTDSRRFHLEISPTILGISLRPEPFHSEAIVPQTPDIYRAEALFKDMMVEEVSRAFARLRQGLSGEKAQEDKVRMEARRLSEAYDRSIMDVAGLSGEKPVRGCTTCRWHHHIIVNNTRCANCIRTETRNRWEAKDE